MSEFRGKSGFFAWLRKYQPSMYAHVQKQAGTARFAGFGLVADAPGVTTPAGDNTTSSSWSDTIKNLITTASQAYLTKEQVDAQKRILDMQMDRVKNGLPLLDIDPQAFGVPSVNVGVSGDTKKTLLYIGGGLALVFLLSQMLRPSRR